MKFSMCLYKQIFQIEGTGVTVETTNTSLNVYPDNTYTTAVTAKVNSYLGQFIYVEMEMFSILGDFIPYNCFATDTNDINSPTAYYLIQNGLV